MPLPAMAWRWNIPNPDRPSRRLPSSKDFLNSILTIRTVISWPHRRSNATAAPLKQKKCWKAAWKPPSEPATNMRFRKWQGCWRNCKKIFEYFARKPEILIISRSYGRSCLPTHFANALPQRIICFLILIVVCYIPDHALPQSNKDSPSTQEKNSDQKKPETAPKAGSIEILSDTQGVDFGRYIRMLRYTVQSHWDPLVPAVAHPPISKSGTVVIEFAIMKDGKVDGMKLTKSSNDLRLDAAAWGAIINSI